MNVEVLFFEGCPSHEATVELVRDTIDRLGLDAAVTEIDVGTDEEAERLKFLGSPSVRVDGEDIESDVSTSTSYGRRCRVYATPEGLRGTPPVEMLEAALTGESYELTGTGGQQGGGDCCASDGPTTVELLVADWCPQCPAAKTFWSDLQEQEHFDLEITDIESERGSDLANEHGIRAVPAIVVNGRVEFRGEPVPDRDSARRVLGR